MNSYNQHLNIQTHNISGQNPCIKPKPPFSLIIPQLVSSHSFNNNSFKMTNQKTIKIENSSETETFLNQGHLSDNNSKYETSNSAFSHFNGVIYSKSANIFRSDFKMSIGNIKAFSIDVCLRFVLLFMFIFLRGQETFRQNIHLEDWYRYMYPYSYSEGVKFNTALFNHLDLTITSNYN